MSKIVCTMAVILGLLYLCEKIRGFFESLQEKLREKTFENSCNKIAKKEEWYNKIDKYSICLSLDYKKNRKLIGDKNPVLNKVIFERIEKFLNEKHFNLQLRSINGGLIILSNDFNSYDKIYDSVLKILSKIKSEILKRYNIILIPSITTDAYTMYPNMGKIVQNHNNIKHCSFINQACTTKAFARKYAFLNNEKYLGTPLGEYSIIDSEKENTYNLNMVNGNLSLALESLG